MSGIVVECIASTRLDEVCEFLCQEWAAFDRDFLGVDGAGQWKKQRHLLRAVVADQTVAVADFYMLGGVAHLSEIIVGRAWRNQGIGAQLMTCFEEIARAAGCHKLSLRTADTSPAVRFYRRLGYQLEGKMVNHYHGLPFLQFQKSLK